MNAKNRVKSINANGTAIIITAALVVLGVLIGGAKSLRGLRAGSEAVFSSGTAASGPDAFDLRADLSEYSGLAANILTVAKRYIPESDPMYGSLNSSRLALNDELFGKSYDIQHSLYISLRDASELLTQRVLGESGVTASDKALLSGNSQDMKSLQTIISRESALYNNRAGAFNETLKSIPASWIRTLGLVKPLSLFNN
jgi:hypothetical protein